MRRSDRRRPVCFHRDGLAERFPREVGWESFLGLPIIASDGRVLGHLAFFDSRPRGNDMLVDSIYRIFLARAAAEIERIQALAKLAFKIRPRPRCDALRVTAGRGYATLAPRS